MRKKLPDILSEEEVTTLLNQPNVKVPTGLRNRCMLELMARGGLRVAEIVNLRPSNIRWETGEIEVKNSKAGRERVVPLHPQVMGWLRLWDQQRPKHSRYFFTTIKRGRNGKPGGQLTTRYCDQMVKAVALSAGVQQVEVEEGKRPRYRIHCHALRHWYATQTLQICSLSEVQQLLGHSNVSVTSVYLHVDPREMRRKIQSQPTTEERETQADKLAAAAEVLSQLAEQARPTE